MRNAQHHEWAMKHDIANVAYILFHGLSSMKSMPTVYTIYVYVMRNTTNGPWNCNQNIYIQAGGGGTQWISIACVIITCGYFQG